MTLFQLQCLLSDGDMIMHYERERVLMEVVVSCFFMLSLYSLGRVRSEERYGNR